MPPIESAPRRARAREILALPRSRPGKFRGCGDGGGVWNSPTRGHGRDGDRDEDHDDADDSGDKEAGGDHDHGHGYDHDHDDDDDDDDDDEDGDDDDDDDDDNAEYADADDAVRANSDESTTSLARGARVGLCVQAAFSPALCPRSL